MSQEEKEEEMYSIIIISRKETNIHKSIYRATVAKKGLKTGNYEEEEVLIVIQSSIIFIIVIRRSHGKGRRGGRMGEEGKMLNLITINEKQQI